MNKDFKEKANKRLSEIEQENERKIFRADRLREVMKEHGADKMDIIIKAWILGLGPSRYGDMDIHIHKIIVGDKIPSIIEIKAICTAVNVSADYLLGLSDKVN